MTFPMPVFSPVVAAGGPTTLSFQASATDGDATVVVPAGVQAGDLLVLVDMGYTGANPPSLSAPSGFTIAQSPSPAVSMRFVLSFKVADGTEGSTTLNGVGGNDNIMILLVFRPDNAASMASANSGGGEVTVGDPSSQSVTASGGTPPLVVVAGYTAVGSFSPRSFSPSADAEITETGSFTNLYVKYRIYNSSPADTTVDCPEGDEETGLVSTYIEVS